MGVEKCGVIRLKVLKGHEMSKKPLTEADLLKAPEKDYMNAAQLEFFKEKLLALKSMAMVVFI